MTIATKRIYAPAGENYPGKKLGTLGVVFVFLIGIVGVVICAVALAQSHSAGYKNNRALAGLILGCISVAIGFVIAVSTVLNLSFAVQPS